jgi:hypothetical protein
MGLSIFSKILSSTSLRGSYVDKTFLETLILCPPSHMLFHWSDALETSEQMRAMMLSNESYSREFKKCDQALSQLRSVPLWIKTEKKIIQTSMYDLYEQYILFEDNLFGTLDPYCPYEISFLSGVGPFRRLSVFECLSESTHREFVIIFLMKGKIKAGDFRLRLKSKILMEYGEQYSKAGLIDLLQLTSKGIIISLNSELYTREYTSLKAMRLLLNSKMLFSLKDKNLQDVSLKLSPYAYNLFYTSNKNDSFTFNLSDLVIESTFDFSEQKKIPLLISYERISDSNPLAAKTLQNFVSQMKELILTHHGNSDELKKVA